MKNKGFTLIELLAVIVILAIIALIAVPIVLNIIENAKDSANKRSIDMYGHAIDIAISNYQIKEGKDPKNVSDLTIEYNGKVECETEKINKDGTIYLAGCKVNDKTVEYTYGKYIKPLCKAATTSTTGYIPNGNYNYGDEYICELGDEVERIFFVLEDRDSTVALIMNQNWDTDTPKWCESSDNNSCNADGLTAKLNEIRTSWTKLSSEQVKLPTYEQIYNVNNSLSVTLTPWLYDYMQDTFHPVSVYSYWTSTPHDTITTNAWVVYCSGKLEYYGSSVNYTGLGGVRPVIEISKDDIK